MALWDKKDLDMFKKEVYDLHGDEYVVVSTEYVTNKVPIEMKHLKCNHQYMVRPDNFINNKQECPNCSINKPKSTELFIEKVRELTGNEYTVIGEYTKSNTKIPIKHNVCDTEYGVIYRDFVNRGRRCPECSNNNRAESREVRKIKKFLDSKSIEYENEVIFEGCKNMYDLPFDFYLPKYNLLIEYDGEQHFRGWSGRKDKLSKVQKNDEIKNNWVKEHEISLLRLNYKQNAVEILKEFFEKRSTTIEKHDLFYIAE